MTRTLIRKQKTCEKKTRYLERAKAQEAAQEIEWATSQRDLHPYRCTVCGTWHVGHRTPWRYRKALRAKDTPSSIQEDT